MRKALNGDIYDTIKAVYVNRRLWLLILNLNNEIMLIIRTNIITVKKMLSTALLHYATMKVLFTRHFRHISDKLREVGELH